ncbi:MAG: hypothetical protein HOB26_06010 [Flavobacteriales bacterium]|jgi:hypothetical protein|nr:hypothetical protein [Flavobacteriales bacterium]
MAENLCLDCQKPLMGRFDKKFCNDVCRNNYNNQQNRDTNNLVRNVNGILRKNRRVLQKLVPEDKRKVKKLTLDVAGFNFEYFTNTYKTKTGQTYFFCYDYGYLPLDNDFFLLVHRNN